MKRYYFKPTTNAQGDVYIIRATITPNRKSGAVSIKTDMHYAPVLEHPAYDQNMSLPLAMGLLLTRGFIEVSEGFDPYDLDDLLNYRDQIPADWLELYKYKLMGF